VAGTKGEYWALQKYLRDRFADAVVLTFSQIEDLLGARLPDAARFQGWWAEPTADTPPSAQSHAWTDAGRTAIPNVVARTVRFDRIFA
jgi:hypothetical protein